MTDQRTSQHVNPILVFVNNDTFRKLYQRVHQDCIPEAVGVTECGMLEYAERTSSYCLVFFNDDEEVSQAEQYAPCKTSANEPLLVVEHRNSNRNEGPWDGGIWGIATVVVVEKFSHEPGDTVYAGIVEILKAQSEENLAKAATTAFVQTLRNKNLLGALDGLAAICQIRLLGEDGPSGATEELETLEEDFLARYPGISSEDYESKCTQDKLSMIQKEANKVLGLVSEQAS